MGRIKIEELVQPGDCVVAFSRKKIYELKRSIERHSSVVSVNGGEGEGVSPGKNLEKKRPAMLNVKSKRLSRKLEALQKQREIAAASHKAPLKCCVIYGSLPPEARRQQATLFNRPGNSYDVLVASDAVGLGLNLNIKRVLFTAMQKFDGTETRPLTVAEIKQVGGRAGRYKSIYPKGYVSCMVSKESERLQKAMETPSLPPIEAAGLYPPDEQIESFLSKQMKFISLEPPPKYPSMVMPTPPCLEDYCFSLSQLPSYC
jgi:superfamily II DNA/RNA helicase